MRLASSTWAVVVGINDYPYDVRLKPLTGAVADAEAACRWLLGFGVPTDHILLHLSPNAPVDDRFPEPLGATKRDFLRSMNRFRLGQARGERLYVFLFGHAIYEVEDRALFLFQDFGDAGAMSNISIEALTWFMQSFSIPRQFLIMDGCQNLPYDGDKRRQIEAGGWDGRIDFTPNAKAAVTRCLSASVGERAYEDPGRGVFSKYLFEAISPAAPASEGVRLDFETGDRLLDLATLVENRLRPLVAADAKKRGRKQTPYVVGAEGPIQPPLLTVVTNPDQVAHITLDVRPAEVVEAVRVVSMFDTGAARSQLRRPQPPDEQLDLPIVAAVPAKTIVIVNGQLAENATWTPSPNTKTRRAKAGKQSIILKYRRRATAPRPPTAPPSDALLGGLAGLASSVAAVTFNATEQPASDIAADTAPPILEMLQPGAILSEVVPMTGRDRGDVWQAYQNVAEALWAQDVTATGEHQAPGAAVWSLDVDAVDLTQGRGWRLITDRLGPRLLLNDAVLPGLSSVSSVMRALEEATPGHVTFGVVARSVVGKHAFAVSFEDERGAEGLAGPLCDAAVVTIQTLDGTLLEQLSLRQLESLPWIPAPSEPITVTVDLPWGRWTKPLVAGLDTEVRLPSEIGEPPVRVLLQGKHPSPSLVAHVPPHAEIRLRPGLFRVARRRLRPASTQSEPLVVELPSPPPRAGLIEVQWAGRTALAALPVGGDLGLWVEEDAVEAAPLSEIALPIWDSVISLGSLAVDPDQILGAARSIEGQGPERSLLALAAAYAAEARQDPNRIREALAMLREARTPYRDALDVAALAGAYGAINPKPLIQRLLVAAAAGEVPMFRWGTATIRRAVRQLGSAELDSLLEPWLDALAQVERDVSMLSAWTNWVEDATSTTHLRKLHQEQRTRWEERLHRRWPDASAAQLRRWTLGGAAGMKALT